MVDDAWLECVLPPLDMPAVLTGHRDPIPHSPIDVRYKNALDGAFSGQVAPPGRSHRARWDGEVIPPGALTEENEQRILGLHDDQLTLLPYGEFDPNRTPVVLVHGIAGAPRDLDDIANRLRRSGRQVFIAFYDDAGTRTRENGRQLATALRELRKIYPGGTPLDIVAHSMGGIVSRAALNTLQNPSWMGEVTDVEALPRAGFSEVRVRTIDTPWDGYPHEPSWLSWLLAPLAYFFMWLFGWLGAYDMRANSDMFEHLFEPELEGVEIQNWGAENIPVDDHVRSPAQISREEIDALARHMLTGEALGNLRLRNMARSLEQDSRYERLKAELEAAFKRLDRDPNRRPEAFVAAYEAVMPCEPGTHVSILRDYRDRDDDVVDRLHDDYKPPRRDR